MRRLHPQCALPPADLPPIAARIRSVDPSGSGVSPGCVVSGEALLCPSPDGGIAESRLPESAGYGFRSDTADYFVRENERLMFRAQDGRHVRCGTIPQGRLIIAGAANAEVVVASTFSEDEGGDIFISRDGCLSWELLVDSGYFQFAPVWLYDGRVAGMVNQPSGPNYYVTWSLATGQRLSNVRAAQARIVPSARRDVLAHGFGVGRVDIETAQITEWTPMRPGLALYLLCLADGQWSAVGGTAPSDFGYDAASFVNPDGEVSLGPPVYSHLIGCIGRQPVVEHLSGGWSFRVSADGLLPLAPSELPDASPRPGGTSLLGVDCTTGAPEVLSTVWGGPQMHVRGAGESWGLLGVVDGPRPDVRVVGAAGDSLTVRLALVDGCRGIEVSDSLGWSAKQRTQCIDYVPERTPDLLRHNLTRGVAISFSSYEPGFEKRCWAATSVDGVSQFSDCAPPEVASPTVQMDPWRPGRWIAYGSTRTVLTEDHGQTWTDLEAGRRYFIELEGSIVPLDAGESRRAIAVGTPTGAAWAFDGPDDVVRLYRRSDASPEPFEGAAIVGADANRLLLVGRNGRFRTVVP
ncbi:MAG: hypothetical protein IT380_14445 [Myxococcales bacterium]|nr:hypothetical protein [Myxococcales bacterium]